MRGRIAPALSFCSGNYPLGTGEEKLGLGILLQSLTDFRNAGTPLVVLAGLFGGTSAQRMT
jgi:hypothetical protein